ncbi:alpha-L-fucosidase [Jiulongibacter sp. NS-SX5]|uniref:alpha-L-fucosidase n=1 Tax=Jiulongibacter sp. NS-SX5 TaxID=3463854 RepID=UPI004057F8FF
MNSLNLKTLAQALSLIFILSACGGQSGKRPEPFGVVPSDRQVEWHDMEFYAFIHFTINTFTDKEWGFGDESPDLFNPTDFDADQIVKTAKNAGMKGLVLTAKHHDGFCLWPTKTTEHNISKSPFKDGKGDIVQEFADACQKHGLKLGLYLSPWDRNNAAYGTPEYIDIFRAQLTELLSNYGDVFEVWFDGANGGDGYYGGANEKRQIDRTTYYDWKNTYALVRKLQPNAVIFSDVGPDVRWVGTEQGFSGDPCWHRYTPESLEEGTEPAPGLIKYWESLNGTREGQYWLPAETNTSIRPGWFYHEAENDKVKSPEKLVDTYYASIGHGTSFILNLTPDKRGLIPDTDIAALEGFKQIIDQTFDTNLAEGAVATSPSGESIDEVLDDDFESFYMAEEGGNETEVIIEFTEAKTFNVVNIREYIPLGQRIWGWALDRFEDGEWVEFAKAESIGNRRLWKGPLQTTEKIRFRVTKAGAKPLISQISVHKEQVRLVAPEVKRDSLGQLSFQSNGTVYYTLDGSEPTKESTVFKGAFDFSGGGTVKAKTYDGSKARETLTKKFGYSPKKWSVEENEAKKAIDEDLGTAWQAIVGTKELIVDFGEELSVNTIDMVPPSSGNKEGMVLNYVYSGSLDGENWKVLSRGEFSNIFNNPVKQETKIEETSIRFLKLEALRTVGDQPMTIVEIGVEH